FRAGSVDCHAGLVGRYEPADAHSVMHHGCLPDTNLTDRADLRTVKGRVREASLSGQLRKCGAEHSVPPVEIPFGWGVVEQRIDPSRHQLAQVVEELSSLRAAPGGHVLPYATERGGGQNGDHDTENGECDQYLHQ